MERAETDRIVYFAADGSAVRTERYPYYEDTGPGYGAELLRQFAARCRDIQDEREKVTRIGIVTADGIIVLDQEV